MKKKVFHDIVEPGTRFGRLTVLGFDEEMSLINNDKMLMCMCDCGTKKLIRQKSLVRGLTKSCGCLRSEQAHDARAQKNCKRFYYNGAHLFVSDWTEVLGVSNSVIYKRMANDLAPAQVINWAQDKASTYIDYVQESWTNKPVRKSVLDAGTDLFSPEENFELEFHVTHSMDLGIRLQLPPLTYGILKGRSGISLNGLPVMVRRDGVDIPGVVKMRVDTGTIDCNYRGSVGLTFTVEPYYPRKEYKEKLLEDGILFGDFSSTADSFYIPAHTKICQLIVSDYRADEWRKAIYLNVTERGKKGFGSSGI